MPCNKKIISLKNVSMNYHTLSKETFALNNISFDVYDKEFVTILGPSGCGKSTVLSLISGMIKPSKGNIYINNNHIDLCNSTVAYMLQRDNLLEWRTIKQNVLLGLEIKKNLCKESRQYALDLLKTYGLEDFTDYYPSQLSGGMRQKVALIRTLAINPQVLLLDEPFSALDYQTRISISEEIKEIIHKEKKTSILVSHDIAEAICLSDRIIILSKRPSKVKKIINIKFKLSNLTSIQKRKEPDFQKYFDEIWQEMNDNE